MEAAGLVLSVAQTLLAALQSPEIRDLFSIWGYKSKLEDLERTVETINSVLLSADSKQVLTPQERDFIDNLKDVVYEADDLIDKFVTTVALQQQHQSPGKVRNFFSSMKELGFGYKMTRKVKKIREMLDRVADDANKFSFKINDLPIRKRREEMSYVVNVDDVVGRDGDKNKIIKTLLNPNCSREDLYVVTIVGMGGLGKTCLAQLVYNDPRIQNEFPLRLWVCVSDEGESQNEFPLKSTLDKILKAMDKGHIHDLNLVQIADKLKEKLIQSSRYLLVLDDVWTEKRNDWVKLKEYLSGLRNAIIMPILEFSYHSLSPSLKSCFTYCAIFPKDSVYRKEKLLDLWMAQGYVEPLDRGQNIEDAAEEYFKILARRCFFQDLENNQFQEVVSFKIHDLMHDMAQQVAGKEMSIANPSTSTVDKRIRHLYNDSPRSCTQGFFVEAKIRTYLMGNIFYGHQFPVSRQIEKWRSLRTLDLHSIYLRSLPDTIGQLLHLRYLDLSDNGELEILPKSLTKLINLQFLNLDGCSKLKELPRDLSKLVNLRTLYVPYGLEHMPLGLAKMTRLTRLNMFIVNPKKSCQKLEELRALRNLKGFLVIIVRGKFEHDKEYMGNTVGENLNSISIEFLGTRDDKNDEQVLEYLQPHTNLKQLLIRGYLGVRMGGWGREDSLTTSLPNLVKIVLQNCFGLEELPWLGRLQHLKFLRLEWLEKVEYMENRRRISRDDGGVEASSKSSTSVESSTALFFPSLESLKLIGMLKLKGWLMGEDEIVNPPAAHILLSFPRLSELNIWNCPNLTSFPLCPNLSVEQLILKGINEILEGKIRKEIKNKKRDCGEGTRRRRRRRRFRGKIRKEIAEKVAGEQGEGTRKENMVTEIVERVVAGEGSSNIFQN